MSNASIAFVVNDIIEDKVKVPGTADHLPGHVNDGILGEDEG